MGKKKPPGLRTKSKEYWNQVEKLVMQSDVLLFVLDARMPELTRHAPLEARIRKRRFIYVLSKSDLVSESVQKQNEEELGQLGPVVSVSAKKRYGKRKLYRMILEVSSRRPLKVGVVGYPNVGKSSLVNLLRGKKSARVSPMAGFTHGVQWVRVNKNMLLVDSPGVIPFKEFNQTRLVLKASLTNLKDYENAALDLLDFLLERDMKTLCTYYGIEENSDSMEVLEALAKKRNKVKKGGVLDLDAAGRVVIQDWQRGNIKIDVE